MNGIERAEEQIERCDLCLTVAKVPIRCRMDGTNNHRIVMETTSLPPLELPGFPDSIENCAWRNKFRENIQGAKDFHKIVKIALDLKDSG